MQDYNGDDASNIPSPDIDSVYFETEDVVQFGELTQGQMEIRGLMALKKYSSLASDFTFKKSWSHGQLKSHLWTILPLLMQYLDDLNTEDNPFHGSFYNSVDEDAMPSVMLCLKKGKGLVPVGNHVLFPTGQDIYQYSTGSGKNAKSVGKRIVYFGEKLYFLCSSWLCY